MFANSVLSMLYITKQKVKILIETHSHGHYVESFANLEFRTKIQLFIKMTGIFSHLQLLYEYFYNLRVITDQLS